MDLLRATVPASMLLAGCLAGPPSDTIADEDAAEASDALVAAATAKGDVARGELPRWHVYQAGRDAPENLYDSSPDTIDDLGAVIAIREGEENERERWVVLSLSWHWKQGDRYFVELMKRAGVSGTRDHETLCKVALAVSTFGACGAAALACVGAEVITFGSVTVPCVWVGIVLCGGHGGAAGLVDCKVVAQ